MVKDILLPPGLENVVHFGASPPMALPCTAQGHTFDELSSCHLAQTNAELIQRNAELRAQVALISENAALARANALLVEQLRLQTWKGRKIEVSPGWSNPTAHLDVPKDAASTYTASTCECSSEAEESDNGGTFPGQRQTTAILKNLPSAYTRADLLDLLDQQGFLGSYDLVYLPVEFQTELNRGYAFVNLTTADNFTRFRDHFTGFRDWRLPSVGVCEVLASDAAQGIDDNIQRYRDSTIMHDSVEDRFKPALFENGRRIPFPAPTKKVKVPRRMKPMISKLT